MADNKKSVLLYCDIIHTIEKMNNETAGQFFKHYLRYINDKDPKTDNLIVDIAFESVKQNLKRDLIKWEQRAEKSRANGKLGGRPALEKKPKKPSGLKNNLTEPRKPDTVTVTVKGNVKDKYIHIHRKFKHLSISTNDFNKLLLSWSEDQINEILDSIENFAQNKKYTSLYLTANIWLKKQYPVKQKSKGKKLTDFQNWEQAQAKAEEIKNNQ
tara:strand:+ start:163 stop:801 length:639 start_codon:yes stop_codon:yes gene_type:complete